MHLHGRPLRLALVQSLRYLAWLAASLLIFGIFFVTQGPGFLSLVSPPPPLLSLFKGVQSHTHIHTAAMSTIGIAEIVVASIQATANVVIVCGVGAWLTRSGVLAPDLSKQLSLLVMYVFDPCMVFTYVGRSIDVPTLLQWWPVMAFCGMYIALGLTLGAGLLCACCR